MAKPTKQNEAETKEILAESSEVITKEEKVVVAPAQVHTDSSIVPKDCAIVIRPKGPVFDVIAVEDGKETVIEKDSDYANAIGVVMRMAKKICLVARGEGSLKP